MKRKSEDIAVRNVRTRCDAPVPMKRKAECITGRNVRMRADAPYVPTVEELTAALHALIAREQAVTAREHAVLIREQQPMRPQWVY
jgi:hypothetical protein